MTDKTSFLIYLNFIILAALVRGGFSIPSYQDSNQLISTCLCCKFQNITIIRQKQRAHTSGVLLSKKSLLLLRFIGMCNLLRVCLEGKSSLSSAFAPEVTFFCGVTTSEVAKLRKP